MREIKFRVWDDHYKYMNYKVIVGTYGEWEKVKDDENYTACSMWIEPEKVDYKCEAHWSHFEPYHKDIKLMQYTGLKDKNGKEIYEGDILKVEKVDLAYIYYDEDRMAWGIKEINEFYFDSPLLSENVSLELEVIGNIYDNPNLLEKGKEE